MRSNKFTSGMEALSTLDDLPLMDGDTLVLRSDMRSVNVILERPMSFPGRFVSSPYVTWTTKGAQTLNCRFSECRR